MPRKAIEKKLGLSRQTVNSALMRSSTRGRPRGDLHARLTVVTDEATVEWLRSLARELRVSMGEVLRRMRLAMTEVEHDSSPRAAADGGG
jgi:hypothetical protein